MNNNITIMREWLDDFERDMESEDELKEWMYILLKYIWKGEIVPTNNRYIRQAFNNMKNNADRIEHKRQTAGKVGHPELLPSDQVYNMRKNKGMTAKQIAEALTTEKIWGMVSEKQVNNNAGWKRYTAEKKAGIAQPEEEEKPTISAPFTF